jgi:N-acetylglucosaminylphosphatidylinositol deacetylase
MEYDFLEAVQKNIRFILSFIIISNFLIIFLLKFSIKLKSKFELFFDNQKKDVLIVTAHPDDEIMFFAPTIKFLLHYKCNVRILCLSNGNYDKIGEIREGEFQSVCKNLKIEDYQIIKDENLQDDIKKKWNEELVSKKIEEYMNQGDNYEKIGSIITFDENGVTKHPNHISCAHGLM